VRILLLCEGDARTHDSWSGVSRSLLTHLEKAGHEVVTADVDLYGLQRTLVALRTAAWTRRRWWVKYHLSESGFTARSAACARGIAEVGAGVDCILQIGATFALPATTTVPVVLYADSNIDFALAGAASGHSDASFLDADEIAEIRAREEQVYHRADAIVSMSHRLRHSFIDRFGIAESKVVTVHCGSNAEVPDDAVAHPGDGPPTVLFVGRDFVRKGGDLLLRAFQRVRERLPEARLRMVGCDRRVEGEPGVEFVPFLSRDTADGRRAMDAEYRGATVFCLPTRFEPFGTVFVEAMRYGLPCVGPDAWAVPEIITHEETGLIVPPEDPEQLAQALYALLTDPARARTFGAAGRRKAEANFVWPVVVDRILEPMQRVVAHAAGRAG
jgi:starch synthase